MKKIVFSIVFLCCTSLFSLEKQFLLTKYLEPSFPFIIRTMSTLDKAVYFCSPQVQNGLFEGIITPLFSSTWYSFVTTFNSSLDRETKKEYISQVWVNYMQNISDPFYQKMVLTSLATTECIIAPLLNYVYPCNPLQLALGSNWMMLKGREYYYNVTKYITQDEMRELFAEKQHTELVLKYTFMNIASILAIYCANYTTPTLFAQLTYLDPMQLTGSYGLLPYLASFLLFNNTSRTEKIGIHTRYFNYSLYQLLMDIDTIFEAKKVLFLTSIILACFYLKPKNKVFTDPAYWIPVGMAHVLYTKYNCPHTLLETSRNAFNIKYNELNCTNRRIATYILYNAVPILAVSMSNMIVH